MSFLLSLVLAVGGGPVPSPSLNTVTKTMAPLTLYVNPSTGNDQNSCTAVGTPCLTLAGVRNRIPSIIRHAVTVNMAPGNYAGISLAGLTWDGIPGGSAYVAFVGTLSTFAPATGTATGTFTSATSCSTLGVHATLTQAGQTWTSNNLRGQLVEITAGTGSGNFAPITDNTATTLTVAGCMTADATSQYAIRTWDAVINSAVANAQPYITSSLTAGIGVFGVSGRSPGSSESLVYFDSVRVNTGASGTALRVTDNGRLAMRRSRLESSSGTVVSFGPGTLILDDTVVFSTATAGIAPFIIGPSQNALANGTTSLRMLQSMLITDNSSNAVLLIVDGASVNILQSLIRATNVGATTLVKASGLVSFYAATINRWECAPGTVTTSGFSLFSRPNSTYTGVTTASVSFDSDGIFNCYYGILASGGNLMFSTDDTVINSPAGHTAIWLSEGARFRWDDGSDITGSWSSAQINVDGSLYSEAAINGFTPQRVFDLTSGTYFGIGPASGSTP